MNESLKERARQFAIDAHGDQKYGDYSYSYHLDAVVRILEPYGEIAQCIGYLHDVDEDTEVGLQDIENEFGSFIAQAVSILSDEPGSDRAERKAKTYSKMSRVRGRLEIALTVKAADRLANLSEGFATNNERMLKTYRKEHDTFAKAAYRPKQCEGIWKDIDALIPLPDLDRP